MNKGDLIETVAAELKLNKTEAGRAVEAVLQGITEGLKRDDKVAITGFGTFTKRLRAARTGINPATKQKIEIAASTTCGFKPGATLKEAL